MKTERCKLKVCNIARCSTEWKRSGYSRWFSVCEKQTTANSNPLHNNTNTVLLQLFPLSRSLEGFGNLGNQKQQIPSSEFLSLQVEGRKLGSFTKEAEDSQQSFSFLASLDSLQSPLCISSLDPTGNHQSSSPSMDHSLLLTVFSLSFSIFLEQRENLPEFK